MMKSRSRSRRRSRGKNDECKHPKGFSMIAHCKALGKIPRTSRKFYEKYMKSPKYIKRSRK